MRIDIKRVNAIIALIIIFVFGFCFICQAAEMRSEAQGNLSYEVTLPEGATIGTEYNNHVESGVTVNYDGDEVNEPTDVDTYKGPEHRQIDISGDDYYCVSRSTPDELIVLSDVSSDTGQNWAYAQGIFYLTINPSEDTEVSLEGQFNYELELDSNVAGAGCFVFSGYSIWAGMASQYVDEDYYVENYHEWKEIAGADNWNNSGKNKFKIKDFDLRELGQSEEYILLFILDSYSHTDEEYPVDAARAFLETKHIDAMESVERSNSDLHGCFITEVAHD